MQGQQKVLQRLRSRAEHLPQTQVCTQVYQSWTQPAHTEDTLGTLRKSPGTHLGRTTPESQRVDLNVFGILQKPPSCLLIKNPLPRWLDPHWDFAPVLGVTWMKTSKIPGVS